MTCSHTFGHHAVVQRYGFIGKTGGHFHASSFEYIHCIYSFPLNYYYYGGCFLCLQFSRTISSTHPLACKGTVSLLTHSEA